MNLTNLFRLHAILAALYALGLLLVPDFIIGILSPLPLDPLGTDLARLFGAALILVTLIAWGASGLTDHAGRRMVASGLFVYVALGAIIAVRGQLAGTWGAWGWSSVITY